MSKNNSSVSSAQGDFISFASIQGTNYGHLEGIHLAVHPQYLELHISRRHKAQILQLYKKSSSSLHKWLVKAC